MLKRTMITMASIIIVLFGAAQTLGGDAAKEQHALIGVAQSTVATEISKDPARCWFPEAGLGLFVHWGLSSVNGRCDLSWGMMGNYRWTPHPLTPNVYWKLANQFNPQDYYPGKWLQAAKDAGFGYAVLTTRHHDGYALWPSEFGDFSTRTKLGGRNLVREYVDACRKVGLKIGFYYSPPDWYFHRQYMSFGAGSKGTPESPHLGLNHEPVVLPKEPAGFNDKYFEYVNGQITELMTRYGKIDLLWFDGGVGPKMLSQEKIRAMQPEIVINDRGHGTGDFHAGPECSLPTERLKGCWEYCGELGSAWGYQLSDEKMNPRDVALRLLIPLVKCRAWGGNVLVNCGPRPTGEMPEPFYGCMDIVKNWMAARRESVVGVQAGPYPERANVPVTVRNKTSYLHLLPTPNDGKDDPAVLKGVEKPQRVTLLGTGESLEFRFDNGTLSIWVPQKLRTKLVDVVRVEYGPIFPVITGDLHPHLRLARRCVLGG